MGDRHYYYQQCIRSILFIVLIVCMSFLFASCDGKRETLIEPSDSELLADQQYLNQLDSFEEEPPVITARKAVSAIPQNASWHWQLHGSLRFPERDVYDIDLFETSKTTIDRLKRQGRIVICYFSAGSFENWRPDAAKFPKKVIGASLEGWAGEWWLDIRQPVVLNIMKTRLNLAARKGCDGVEPDNVDGHENHTGFKLSTQDMLRYNRKLVAAAHQRGLLIGLKNALGLVAALESSYDFALNEECYSYNECQALRPFVQSGKAVFIAEYQRKKRAWCQQAKQAGYQLQFFRLNLDTIGKPC